jgi:hypothetical protein
MPGLLRGVARTAAIAGTATAVSNRVSRRQAGRWSRQEAEAAPPQGYQEPAPQQPAPAPAGTSTQTKLAQLKQLGELHTAGVLDDAEFELEKSKILDS